MLEHLYDLAALSYRQGRPVDSDFLSPEAASEFLAHQKEFAYVPWVLYRPEWERKLLHFGPGQADIALLEITSRSSAFVKLAHPDYLGALLGLGLDRKVLGDLIVQEDRAYAYVKGAIAPFIVAQLNQVGRARVTCQPIEALPLAARPQGIEEELVVSSLRLDRMVSSAFRLSRGKAQEAIRSGLVFIEGCQIIQPDRILEEGARVSFRHKGKIRLVRLLRRTKKEAYVVLIERYGA